MTQVNLGARKGERCTCLKSVDTQVIINAILKNLLFRHGDSLVTGPLFLLFHPLELSEHALFTMMDDMNLEMNQEKVSLRE